MIRNRLHGLANLHLAFATALALLLLVAMAQLTVYISALRISPDLSLLPYLMCVGIGMLFSGRFVHALAGSFHRLRWTQAAWLTTRQIMTVAVMLFAFMFAFKDRSMSRVFISIYMIVTWLMLLGVNVWMPALLAQMFFLNARKVPTLFVGSAQSLKRLGAWLSDKETIGLQPVGFLSLDDQYQNASVPNFVGHVANLGRHIAERHALQVILLEIPRDAAQGHAIVDVCQQQGSRLLIYSNLAEQFRHPLVTVEEEGYQFYTLQTEPLEDPINRVLKRGFDVAVSLPVVLFLLPPLYVWVALMQRLQAPGPVLFAQMRTGHNQRPFRLLKFRSMRVDNPDETKQARKGDGRIYPFGAFLRRTSLDEFPQFWNVLTGHMSLVGPRPHMIAHDSEFAAQLRAYRTRFFVKPGITGLAQCSGLRGEITDPELLRRRIDCDLAYINSWSIWLDVQLVARTAWQVISPPKSAY